MIDVHLLCDKHFHKDATSNRMRRNDIETVSALLVLSVGKPPINCWFPSKGPSKRSCYVCFAVSLNKLLKKLSSYRWFETAWRVQNHRKLPEFGQNINMKMHNPHTVHISPADITTKKKWNISKLYPTSPLITNTGLAAFSTNACRWSDHDDVIKWKHFPR